MRKLKAFRGETLVETLAAILIVALASILFLQLSTAAGSMHETAASMDKSYQKNMAAAEKKSISPDSSDVVTFPGTVTVSGSSGDSSAAVDFYAARSDSPLASYAEDTDSEAANFAPSGSFDLKTKLGGPS